MKKHQYIVNRWSIDLTSGFISHQESGEQKRLGEYQLKLLNVLLQHPGQILSRDELTNLVWKRRVIGNNSLPNAVHTLRVALGDDKKQQRIIQTIPKIGYLLDATYCEIIEEDEVTPVSDTDIAINSQPLIAIFSQVMSRPYSLPRQRITKRRKKQRIQPLTCLLISH